MKITIASDLHLEFETIRLDNESNADVLVLAGDIVCAAPLRKYGYVSTPEYEIHKKHELKKLASRFSEFFDHVSKQYKTVVCVAGNHELYGDRWVSGIDILRNFYMRWSNVRFLEDGFTVIDDVPFIGSTLWTDMHNSHPIVMYDIEHGLNDYLLIRNDSSGFKKLKATDTIVRHKTSLERIKTTLERFSNQSCVVVSHHAPTHLSSHPRYHTNDNLNFAYHSDLGNMIAYTENIKLWVHGHTHDCFDYNVGGTRVVCNPRGYVGYESAEKFSLKTIEL